MVSETITAPPEYEQGYKLPRNSNEALRLACQHDSLVERQGWLLHPTVQKAVSKLNNPQIADVACGTGVWAFDIAKELPNATVVGLDISPDLFPPKWTWSNNCTLEIFDLLKDVPSKYLNKFDVVHCRLLLAAGPDVDWRLFVRTFRQLLKPGGYLQWDEIPYNNLRTVEPILENDLPTGRYHHTTIPFDNMARLINFPAKSSWVFDWKDHMAQVDGFSEVEQYDTPVCAKTLQLETDVAIAVVRSMAEIFLNMFKNKDLETVEAIKSEVKVFEDIKAAGTMFGYYWIIGVAKAA